MRQIIWDILIYAINALPPSYRLIKFLLFVQAAFYPLDWRKRYLDKYLYSSPADSQAWSGIVTYSFYTEVSYNYAIYVSLIDNNLNNIPDQSSTWFLVNKNWVGFNERIRYNGRYLTLTWALNRYFNTTFRQPPYPTPYGGSGTFSDIYITNEVTTYPTFISGLTEDVSDNSGTTISSGFATLVEDFVTATSYKFKINIPTAVYAIIGGTGGASVAESIVRGFADKYVPSGILYDISTY